MIKNLASLISAELEIKIKRKKDGKELTITIEEENLFVNGIFFLTNDPYILSELFAFATDYKPTEEEKK